MLLSTGLAKNLSSQRKLVIPALKVSQKTIIFE
jgi:hypothetical protein